MRGKYKQRAEVRRDRAELVAAAETAEHKANRAQAERDKTLAKAEHRVTSLQAEVAELKRLAAKGSAPEVERLRAQLAEQHITIERLDRTLRRWLTYRRRFDSRLARTLARNFDLAVTDAKSIVVETWFLTVGNDAGRVREMYDWLSEIQPGTVSRAVHKKRITPEQADLIATKHAGRTISSGKRRGNDHEFGRLWTSDEDMWDDERDAGEEVSLM